MKFDSSAIPRLPTPQQITEIHDLMTSATELQQIYSTLERHSRIVASPKALELFSSCRQQLHQDLEALGDELAKLGNLSHERDGENVPVDQIESAAFAHDQGEGSSAFRFTPDVEPIDLTKSVFEIVKRSFQVESQFTRQLATALATAQSLNHLKLQLQLKMVNLSAAQRQQLLDDRYGYARSKSLLLQELRRETTRFLSAINGEKRQDIDR